VFIFVRIFYEMLNNDIKLNLKKEMGLDSFEIRVRNKALTHPPTIILTHDISIILIKYSIIII
jgi:hypothetical protein